VPSQKDKPSAKFFRPSLTTKPTIASPTTLASSQQTHDQKKKREKEINTI